MSKNKLLIIGAGGLGRMTLDIAENNYDCFFMDDGYEHGHIICSTKVVGKISELNTIKNGYDCCVVALGDNKLRERVTKECLQLGLKIVSIISPTAYISKWAKIGVGCIFMPYATVQNSAVVGDGTILCSHVEIHHDSTIGNFCVIYPNSSIRTYSKIGNRVKCGSNVSVSNDAIVDDDQVIENGQIILK